MGMKFWQQFWQHWRKDLSLRLLALAAAIALWFYVSSEPASFEGEATSFLEAVPNVQGLSPDLELEPLPSVFVKLEGPKGELSRIKAENLVYIQIANREGAYPVRLKRLPAKVRVVSVEPQYVDVKFKELGSIEVDVQVELPGSALLEFKATPQRVTVKGEKSELAKVSTAIVRATGEEGRGPVIVLDKNGRALPLEVKPETVKYLVKEEQPLATKLVPVENPTGVILKPEKVRLWGPEAELQKIDTVSTEPLPDQDEGEIAILVPTGVTKVEPEKVSYILE